MLRLVPDCKSLWFFQNKFFLGKNGHYVKRGSNNRFLVKICTAFKWALNSGFKSWPLFNLDELWLNIYLFFPNRLICPFYFSQKSNKWRETKTKTNVQRIFSGRILQDCPVWLWKVSNTKNTFLSNHKIHKTLCCLWFWAPDLLIDRLL